MNNKKILILGATGAMAVYLIPELLKKGYCVDGVSLDDVKSTEKNLTYIQADAMDTDFLANQLKTGYDAIVDFMIYRTVELFEKYYKLYSQNTSHYVFLSSYRVYADDSPLNENSKRLFDTDLPSDFERKFEYSIYKAEAEDFLHSSDFDNYTIIRPAITYSKRRFQLTTLEADTLVYRMLNGKTVILPEGAMDKQATMTWAGDVAKMISAIVLNPACFREVYNVSTSEHMTWREVAAIYEKIGNLKYITVDDETYLDLISGKSIGATQQLKYDRCFNRIVDNTKILSLCNMKQSDLMPLCEGLKKELENLSPESIKPNEYINKRMDEYLDKQK